MHEAPTEQFSGDVLKLVGEQSPSSSASLSSGERWNLARYLGALSQFGLQGKPLKRASRRTENIEQILVTTGASLITDQSACFKLLDRLRVPQVGVSNIPLLSEIFPQLLAMLRRQLNGAERPWMLNLLDAYVTDSSHRGSAVLWERRHRSDQTGGEPHRRPKARNPTIARMLAQTGESAHARQTRAGRQKFAISDEDFLRLQANRNSLVGLKTAARYAGMSCGRIQELVKAGLVASRSARIDIRSIDRFLSNVATACGRNATMLEEPVSLTAALRFHVPVAATAALFHSVMAGAVRLRLESGGGPAMQNIFAERGDVISVIRKSAVSDSTISIVEAACRLGVKQEVMYHLINVGLVRTRTGTLRRRAARVVDVDDLREFDEQFMSLVTVAKAMRVSARKAPEWAMRHGIEIVSGPSVDGGRQYWIRRNTVPRACRSTESAA